MTGERSGEDAAFTQVGWRWRAKRICATHDHPFGPWKMDVSVPDDEGLTIEYQPLYIVGPNTVATTVIGRTGQS